MTEKIVAQKKCSLENCEAKVKAKGLCQRHWVRLRKHGDVNFTLKNAGVGDTFEQRFWSRVAVTANPEKCWEWQAYRSVQGYGKIVWKNRSQRAHRVAFELFYGYEPKLKVRHVVCDNPPCCNPYHLKEGTPAENSQDMVDKGRQTKGESHYKTSLTEDKVLNIRQLSKIGLSYFEISQKCGVSKSAVAHIVKRRVWKHI